MTVNKFSLSLAREVAGEEFVIWRMVCHCDGEGYYGHISVVPVERISKHESELVLPVCWDKPQM